MERTIELFEIKMIKFNNYTTDFRIVGRCIQNNLSYETELILGQTNLNLLINQLQKLNPDVEVSELLETELLPGGELHYTIDSQQLNNKLPFGTLVEDRVYKQIRA